jgi:uncharacterized protein YmfQ (DUF2313 family)
MSLFKSHTQEEHRRSLAEFLPDGKAISAKNREGSNLFKFLYGCANELMLAEGMMNLLADEHDVTQTTLLIDYWERALGIPDGCFPTGKDLDIETRRNHVKLKLTFAIGTRQSFIDLAHALGFAKCVIHNGAFYGRYPLPYAWTYYGSDKEANFTVYVHLERSKKPDVYPFSISKYPWPYASNSSNILECLFTKLAPATVVLKFIYDLD